MFKVIDNINTTFREQIVKTAIVFVILATIYLLSGNIFLSFICSFAVGIVLLGWDSRVYIGFGLIFLIACPFLLAFEKKTTAEQMAVYAYYMLALGVILQIVQYFKEAINSEKKKVKISDSRKMLIYAIGTTSLVSGIFAGCFTLFYQKIESKLNENNKLISELITARQENTSLVLGAAKVWQQGPADPRNVKITVENTSGQKGTELKIAEIYKNLGFGNVSISIPDTATNEGTLVLYCSGCFDTVSQLTAVLRNPAELLIIEKPELTEEIIIRLGTDQIILNNSEISVSILNGSAVKGLAKELKNKMTEQGFNVTRVTDADKYDYQNLIIRYPANNTEKARIVKEYLAAFFNAPVMLEVTKLTADVEIVLGNPQ